MTWMETFGQALKAYNLTAWRRWGGQSKDQASLEADIKEAQNKKWIALYQLQEAQRAGNKDLSASYLVAANNWDQRLRQLQADAASRFP
jgi:hypothetical protein